MTSARVEPSESLAAPRIASSILDKLPSELQILVSRHLKPSDVLSLSQTCRALLSVCRTDDIWRYICEDIASTSHRRLAGRLRWEEYELDTRSEDSDWTASTLESANELATAAARSSLSVPSPGSPPASSTSPMLKGRKLDLAAFLNIMSFWELAVRFLLPNQKFLGWWASESPYVGRLIRIRIDEKAGLIVAEELTGRNGYTFRQAGSLQAIPSDIPLGAIFNQLTQNTYYVPAVASSPDRGYEVDLFDPVFDANTIFTVDPSEGVMSASRLRMHLAYRPERTVVVNAALTAHVLPSNPTFSPDATIFPSRSLLLAGALRNSPKPVPADPHAVQLPAFSIEPARNFTVEGGSAYTAPGRGRGVGDTMFIFQDAWAEGADAQAAYLNLEHDGQHLRINFSTGSRQRRQADFFPIKAPTIRRSSNAIRREPDIPFRPSTGGSAGRSRTIRASSVAGIWCGTYDAHGIEFGYVSVRRVPSAVHRADELALEEVGLGYIADGRGGSPNLGLVADEQLQGDLLRRAAGGPGAGMRTRRIIEYVKLTGDTNVPRGETSWIAFLPDEDLDLAVRESRTIPVRVGGGLGEVPTASSDDLLRWANEGIPGDDPRYERICIPAKGKLARPGFVEPRWCDAEVNLIRSVSSQDEDVVDEIRIRWCDLGKKSIFRRVVEIGE